MSRGHWERRLQQLWYGDSRLALLLLPLSWLFCLLALLRRLAYRSGLLASQRLDAPVIVVGNLSVGGSGKTPLVIALAHELQAAGFRVGILSRGYGGRARHWPVQVSAASDPGQVGDEAVLVAERTGVPVFAGPDRAAAGRALLASAACDLLVCDDGLQHYGLRRDFEIAVVDGQRRHGNGHCLPAGPLREPLSRLRGVDAVAYLGAAPQGAFGVQLKAGYAMRLGAPSETRPLESFRGERVHAVAGIGNPQRFFASLHQAGLDFEQHLFPDHHPFRPADLAFGDSRPVLMTEKDAVKCRSFAQEHWWSLRVEAHPDAALLDRLLEFLN